MNQIIIVMKKTPLMSKVKSMDVGDRISVPCEAYAYNTVRRYTSDLSFMMSRKYSTHLDRETRTFVITRQS